MARQELINELRIIIEDFLKEQNLVLVALDFRYEGKGLALRILVDKPEGGIILDECAYLNEQISRLLDEKDILQQRYTLEISSPGLDRPLNSKNDFLRCINKRVRFFLKEAIDGKMEMEGVISRVGDDAVYVAIEDKVIEMPLLKIAKAKQAIVNI